MSTISPTLSTREDHHHHHQSSSHQVGEGDNDDGCGFTFNDNDLTTNEINELYSYTELLLYKKLDLFNLLNNDLYSCNKNEMKWNQLKENDKLDYIQGLLSQLELSAGSNKTDEPYQRYLLKSRLLMFIAQGAIDYSQITIQTVQSSLQASYNNCKLLRASNALPILLKSLLMASKMSLSHIQKNQSPPQQDTSNLLSVPKQQQQSQHQRGGGGAGGGGNTLKQQLNNSKKADALMNSLLNTIYLMIVAHQDDKSFIGDINENIDIQSSQTIISIMLDLVQEFGHITPNIHPIKKILMVLRKSLTISLGGFKELDKLKKDRLKKLNYDLDTPKTSSKDISNFIKGTTRFHHLHMEHSKLHRVETHLLNVNSKDTTKKYELFRLPSALSDSLNVLEKNMYPPLQVELEIGYPSMNRIDDDHFKPRILLQQEEEKEEKEKEQEKERDTLLPFEKFYSLNLNEMHIIIFLLQKILLACEQNYNGNINLMAEIIIDSSPGSSASLVETMQSTVDLLRHKEIIMKNIVGILLLLLKHSKFNHLIQFDNLSSIMIDGNGLILLFKYLNQESPEKFLSAHNFMASDEFYPIDPSLITAECWRNYFSIICILRILQKLSKNLPSRICSIAPTKSVNILKKWTHINQISIRLYSLKLIKNLIPWLAKKWRMNNMRIITDIYLEVPLRINDIWLTPQNDLPSTETTQQIEMSIQERIQEFHSVNYEQWQNNLNMD
ncbi:FAM40 family protein [Cavenderia fasciculata]|uniref:FAM40 family protein n=1 Tax=Cavenderia fasciculata TaxID=261658 RepID=F4PSC2_CACFS|nr:FAM40 family protein [Cavenderia fasciculata]EGG20668.1 FAM40 family protein [Cavenderia fasciculata]|eukprot:XP_004358518.1 FAM40 family protein [Cavenderia fasciculata]